MTTEPLFDRMLEKFPGALANAMLGNARRMLWARGEREAAAICAHIQEEMLRIHLDRLVIEERRQDL